jgi:carbonic anhydrase/acetyltransferase-like protein (isoleucine patch superfamily)
MPIYEINGSIPKIGKNVFIAPDAIIIGNVEIGDNTSIWFGCVIRGDVDRIVIGPECNIQDKTVIHCAKGKPTILANRVSVGHAAILEGCRIEEGAVIGMGSILLHDVHIGKGSMVAAGAVLLEGFDLPAGMLAAGIPAKVMKRVSDSSREAVEGIANRYVELKQRYLKELKLI